MCDCIKLSIIFQWTAAIQTLKTGVQRSEMAIFTQKEDTTPYMAKSGLQTVNHMFTEAPKDQIILILPSNGGPAVCFPFSLNIWHLSDVCACNR